MLLPFLSSNPKILKAFVKTFPTKMKPTTLIFVNAHHFLESRKAKKEGPRRKVKVKTAVGVTFKPKILLSAHA